MHILNTSSEADMILEFLRAEMASPRFGPRYQEWISRHGFPKDIAAEHLPTQIRKDLLWAVRPGMVQRLPSDIVWHNVDLEERDWDAVMYMNETIWNNFSDGTRRVQQGAKKLGLPHHERLAQRVQEMSAQLKNGMSLPKIILVTTPDRNRFVVLEGHARATAYVASGLYRRKKIPALLGISLQMTTWPWF